MKSEWEWLASTIMETPGSKLVIQADGIPEIDGNPCVVLTYRGESFVGHYPSEDFARGMAVWLAAKARYGA